MKTDRSETRGCLLWEDDIVILSESEEGLQKMLQYLSNYMLRNLSNYMGGNLSNYMGGNLSNYMGGNLSNYMGGNLSNYMGGNRMEINSKKTNV